MSVERSIKVKALDGETVIAELTIQDGGAAADVNVARDWFTPQSLIDLSTACLRMVDVIKQYQATGGGE